MGLGERPDAVRPLGRRAGLTALALTALVAASTALMLSYRFGWAPTGQLAMVSAIYGAGVGTGFAFALAIVSLCATRLTVAWRFALCCILAAIGMLAATFIFFLLEHRIYYGQWHAPVFSRVWVWQQAFTALGAGAQFAVMGVRYLGLPALALIVLASWWVHRPAD